MPSLGSDEFNLSLEDIRPFYNKYLVWLCWEAAANASRPAKFPDLRKIQAIPANVGEWRTREAGIHKGLAAKFPTGRTGNSLTRTANFSLQLQGPPSPLYKHTQMSSPAQNAGLPNSSADVSE